MAKKSKKSGTEPLAPSDTELLPEVLYVRSSHDVGESDPSKGEMSWPVANKSPEDFSDGDPIAVYQRVRVVTVLSKTEFIETPLIRKK